MKRQRLPLFGQVVLVRNWGWIGTRRGELVEEHPSEAYAGDANIWIYEHS
jgi:hypothetical protein